MTTTPSLSLSLGATQLPLQHLSIRVPWHDNRWNGTVCQFPAANRLCRILKNIGENKDDDHEERIAGQRWAELEERQLPPCVSERGGFMAPFPLTVHRTHPYASWSKAHTHFSPTPLRQSPYSAAVVPFGWTLREKAEQRVGEFAIHGYDPAREDRANALMGRRPDNPTSWLQTKRNQRAVLDTFFGALQPEASLVFFYAKRTPLAPEDTRRVIVGVGRVSGVGEPVEYRYHAEGELEAIVWDREVRHTIRPDMRDGFLLPYHELLEHWATQPELDLASFAAFAPDEAFDAFSYGAEHVGHDHAIAALLACSEALRRTAAVLPGDWETPLAWIDARLNELWTLRGPCPGLGSALTAYGIEHGTFLAYELARVLGPNEDPWPAVDELFADTSALGEAWQRRISPALAAMWATLPEERRQLLRLLSRFSITAAQATRFFNEHQRKAAGIVVSDGELLANPYLLFERDRWSAPPAIGFATIDRGVFPDPVVRDQHPLPTATPLDDPADPRRVRALLVDVLEQAASAGDTLRSRDQLLQAVDARGLSPACPLSYDLLALAETTFDGVLRRVAMAGDEPAWQLGWLGEMGQLIAREIDRRAGGRPHAIDEDWRARLDAALPRRPLTELEARAREEKAAALAVLAAGRVSVLIGPAGTGKTTLLNVLCQHPRIDGGGILLLAPTGKARVQLTQRTGRQAKTIAQFLVRRGQYNPDTGQHTLSTREPETAYRTVIIDEASMLTEDQLAAVLSAFDRAPVERLILVGDPRQLPPIGAGRPFVDIINRLRPAESEHVFPRVGPGYAELTVVRRGQEQEDVGEPEQRDDLLLARWFSGQPLDPAADEVWTRVGGTGTTDSDRHHLRFVRWHDETTLHETLFRVLAEELGLAGPDDTRGFEISLGGVADEQGRFVYFNRGQAACVDRWQILSPVNLRAWGVEEINRAVQRHYRRGTLEYARSKWRKIPEPTGMDQVVYGDKVINVVNKRRTWVWPEEGDPLRYVANGEIGLVIGRTSFGGRGKPDNLWVEFSSQPRFGYDFWPSEFGDEGAHPLQLAYAITIHKAQGSEFGKTFIVLPDPLPMLSRELLYTALTRQQEKVIILHQGDLSELKRYDSIAWSETARRQTNLFAPPAVVRVGEAFLEEALIHRTARGVPVRSKSEVIIADRLDAHGLPYSYEQPLPRGDGGVWYPDFTIEDAATGDLVYWEHLGLLHDATYERRWQRKLDWYRAHGVLPREEGGGPNGLLVTSRDDARGGIDSAAIDALIQEVFGR